MFLVSSSKYLLTPKIETGQKLPFHNCRSAGWLVEYGIAKVSRP